MTSLRWPGARLALIVLGCAGTRRSNCVTVGQYHGLNPGGGTFVTVTGDDGRRHPRLGTPPRAGWRSGRR